MSQFQNEVSRELTKKDLRKVNTARGLAKWLSIDITISIFGVVVFQWHFPPQDSEKYSK